MLSLLLAYLPDEDHQQFTEVYNKYRPIVRYIAYERLKKRQDIEDSVQETFLYIAKKFGEIKHKDDEAMKGYICAAARGFAITYYRKRESMNKKTYAYVDTITKKVTDNSFEFVNRLDLEKAMEKLNEEERSIVELKFVYGMSSQEVAEIHGLSPANARKKLERIKVKLKKELEK